MLLHLPVRPALLAAFVLVAGLAHAGQDRILLQSAYGTPHTAWVQGRLVEASDDAERPASPQDGRWRNLRRTLRQFSQDERKQQAVTVHIGTQTSSATTDHEGYFEAQVAGNTTWPDGWQTVDLRSAHARQSGQALIVPPHNTLGLVSDLDDTILVSNVLSKRRLLRNTLLQNATQRQAVPGMAALYRQVAAHNPQPGAAPVFYLSASPRQLQGNITAFLRHNGFPQGVVLARRISADAQSDPWRDTFAYKTRQLETLLARLPHVQFILAGDDGEQDPEIYAAIHKRFPDRIRAVWIRRVHPDPQRARFAGQGDFPAAFVPAP